VAAAPRAIDALIASDAVEVLACRADDLVDPSPHPLRSS
jgi:hypothetical protein